MPKSKDYYPLIPGLTLCYAHVDYSSREPEVSRLVWRVERVSRNGSGVRAQVKAQWGASPPRTHEVLADEKGIWVGKNLEIRLPPRLNDSWEVEEDDYYFRSVFSLKAKAGTMVRDFKGCLEIGFSNQDTDSGTRLYAPGIGLVREQRNGETFNSVLSLAHWEIPRP